MKLSTIMTSVDWKNGRLTLKHKRYLALGSINLFLAVCCWILIAKELPVLIQGALCLGICTLIWSLWDVFRTALNMQYVPKTDFLTIKAKQGKRLFLYSGQGEGLLRIKHRIDAGSDGGVDTFNIILQFENAEACIPVLLESLSYSEKTAAAKIQTWSERLNLKNPT